MTCATERPEPAPLPLARQALELNRGLSSRDVRFVRPRIALLDALQPEGELLDLEELFEESERLARGWRARCPCSHPDRAALCDSRLGMALLGLGRLDEAGTLFERSAPAIREKYPRTWYEFQLEASQLELHARLGRTERTGELRARIQSEMSLYSNDQDMVQHCWRLEREFHGRETGDRRGRLLGGLRQRARRLRSLCASRAALRTTL